MRTKKVKTLYHIELEFVNGITKLVKIKASNRETAEQRALKFNPSAIKVKRHV